MPVPEVAKHLVCSKCGARNGETYKPLPLPDHGLDRPRRKRPAMHVHRRSPIQFSDHVDCDGAKFFKAAADLGLEGIVSKRAASRYRSGPPRSWLKTKNMVERASSSCSALSEPQTACPGRC
jgi:hypothetical protein